MCKLDSRLFRGHNGKYVVICSFENALKNSEIGNHATSVEVFSAVEEDIFSIYTDSKVVVTRIHCTADKVVVRNDKLVETVALFGCAYDVCHS